MIKHLSRRASALCLVAILMGCQSSRNSIDSDPSVPPPPEGIKVQVVPDKQLRVLSPTIEFDSGVMNISGFVRRKKGVRGIITGRVDIEVLDADGTVVDWIPALLVPASIPSEGRGEAGYLIHYGWIPPEGSVIRVRFADSDTAAQEDLNDGDTAGGKYGTRNGHGAGGARHGRGHM